jgi:predicted nucleic acid-binding protein
VIVVDTNIIAYFYLSAQHGQKCRQLMAKDLDWLAPILWRSEFRNVLIMQVRHNILAFDKAIEFQSDAEQQMSGNERQVNSDDVLRLAQSSGRSAYDCEYVALAESLGIRLVTEDQQLLKAFPTISISLDDAIA